MNNDYRDAQSWVEEHGDSLYRFALSRVYDQTVAEDLVQITFLSALKGIRNFKGDCSIKTWLFSILKHKILDHFRKKNPISMDDIKNLDSVFYNSFNEKGRWNKAPQPWQLNPEEVLEQNELLRILWDCVQALPEKLQTIFTLKEIEGESTNVICENLSLTVTNFGVIIHRIRHKLRDCFSSNGIISR